MSIVIIQRLIVYTFNIRRRMFRSPTKRTDTPDTLIFLVSGQTVSIPHKQASKALYALHGK